MPFFKIIHFRQSHYHFLYAPVINLTEFLMSFLPLSFASRLKTSFRAAMNARNAVAFASSAEKVPKKRDAS